MYSVADIEGLNQLSRTVIANAALAMVGMVDRDPDVETAEKPTIGITMFGVTTPCVQTAREWLEEQGYETIVFHATGTGGRAMEALIEEEGVIDGVLDTTTTEWADELVGGVPLPVPIGSTRPAKRESRKWFRPAHSTWSTSVRSPPCPTSSMIDSSTSTTRR